MFDKIASTLSCNHTLNNRPVDPDSLYSEVIPDPYMDQDPAFKVNPDQKLKKKKTAEILLSF
jgi:hypothetical protein